jgi:hypothetical protein
MFYNILDRADPQTSTDDYARYIALWLIIPVLLCVAVWQGCVAETNYRSSRAQEPPVIESRH